MPRKFSFKQK